MDIRQIVHGMRFLATRHLLLVFLALTLAPALALVYVGWRSMKQDEIVARQGVDQRQIQATDLIVTALHQAIAVLRQQLGSPSTWSSIPQHDARVLVLSESGVEASYPPGKLAYYPQPGNLPEAAPDLFYSGEQLEKRLRDYPAAIAHFKQMASSADSAVRAGALLRLARNLRHAGKHDEALDAYSTLAREKNVAVSAGLPADLVARTARCSLLEQLRRMEDMRSEAGTLRADLEAGLWHLDRAAYTIVKDDTHYWLSLPSRNAPHAPESDRELLAAAVSRISSDWVALGRSHESFIGSENLVLGSGRGTLFWQPVEDRVVLFLVGPEYIQRVWHSEMQPLLDSQGVRLAIEGAEPSASDASGIVRKAADTNLPWTIRVESADPEADLARSASRRRLFLAAMVLLLAVVSAGGYLVARAVARELALARLQSDFVAAVSHEFRTPLTSLRQVTEILTDGRVIDPSRLTSYYQTQARATDRLLRLVESLLDFGRMEAGAKPYRMQRLDAAEWARSVVDEFQAETGHPIDLHTNAGTGAVEADPAVLAHALRNLLDNAVKYSPGFPQNSTVRVDVGGENGRLKIRVSDQGMGIPRSEHEQIFGRFVRGAAAKANGVKGTGVGLAMVRHIVDAHGGEIRLESEPGKGSVFTILLKRDPSTGSNLHVTNPDC